MLKRYSIGSAAAWRGRTNTANNKKTNRIRVIGDLVGEEAAFNSQDTFHRSASAIHAGRTQKFRAEQKLSWNPEGIFQRCALNHPAVSGLQRNHAKRTRRRVG